MDSGLIARSIAGTRRAVALVGDAIAGTGRAMFNAASAAWYQVIYARTRFDYRADIGDPLQSSIVAALIGWIARNFPEAPIRIYQPGRPTRRAVEPGPTGAGFLLRLLERPNRYYSGALMWQAVITDYMVGDAYLYKVRTEAGRVAELWWLPAWMIEPRWDERDPTSFIAWYGYRVDGQVYRLELEDVVHFRNGMDPKNPRKGLGRLGSLFREIFTDNEAATMTATLMRNLGVPGVIIAPANTNTGPSRSKPGEIKQKFEETFGGDGRGGTLVLTRPTEVKVLSWSPEQMNLRELRRIPEERASAVLGIPAGVAGLGAGLDRNTFSNYGEANVAAYTQGVIPLQRQIAAELEVQLLDEFVNLEDGWDIEFDWTQVKAMAAFVAGLWARYESAATKGLITRADFKRATFQAVAEGGLDDVYIVPNNYAFLPAREPSPIALPRAAGRAELAAIGYNGADNGAEALIGAGAT